MKKALKELIEKAEPYNQQPLNDLLIIPNNKKYNGFWGKNGYNQIILLGRNHKEDKVYRIDTTNQHDVIDFYGLKDGKNGQIDIPYEYNCIRLNFGRLIKVDNSVSALVVEEIE